MGTQEWCLRVDSSLEGSVLAISLVHSSTQWGNSDSGGLIQGKGFPKHLLMLFSSEQTCQVLRGFKGCDRSSGQEPTSVDPQGCCQELIHALRGRTYHIRNAFNPCFKVSWVLLEFGKSLSLSSHPRHNLEDMDRRRESY